jgi:hypothetical protein
LSAIEFDDVDAIGEVSEADFFRVITERKTLDKLAQSYPSPRERHDVPLWVYMASNLSMRFHGEHYFHAFPFLVRSGSMIEAFGPAGLDKTAIDMVSPWKSKGCQDEPL